MTFVPETECKSRREVAKKYAGAAVIAKCCGGWMVFGTIDEYRLWRAQK